MSRWLACASALLLLGACGEKDKPAVTAPASVAVTPTPAPPGPSFRGVIRGVIKLAEGASVPLGPDPKASTAVSDPTKPCNPLSDADRRVVLADDATRGLWPVHVAITGMKSMPKAEPRTHQLRAIDCRFEPSILGVQVGDTVNVENASPAVLATSFPGQSFIDTLPIGAKKDIKITGTGVFLAGCPLGAYCGLTRIIAVAHPLYAITDTKGAFRIENVPLGEEVVVHAWHPLFGESNVTVTLDESAPEREVTLALTPVPLPPEAKAEKPARAEGAEKPAKGKKKPAEAAARAATE